MEETEQFFACPYCGQTVSMILDLSARQQRYIEDCEVCCRPIEIRFRVEHDEVASFSAERTDA